MILNECASGKGSFQQDLDRLYIFLCVRLESFQSGSFRSSPGVMFFSGIQSQRTCFSPFANLKKMTFDQQMTFMAITCTLTCSSLRGPRNAIGGEISKNFRIESAGSGADH